MSRSPDNAPGSSLLHRRKGKKHEKLQRRKQRAMRYMLMILRTTSRLLLECRPTGLTQPCLANSTFPQPNEWCVFPMHICTCTATLTSIPPPHLLPHIPLSRCVTIRHRTSHTSLCHPLREHTTTLYHTRDMPRAPLRKQRHRNRNRNTISCPHRCQPPVYIMAPAWSYPVLDLFGAWCLALVAVQCRARRRRRELATPCSCLQKQRQRNRN